MFNPISKLNHHTLIKQKNQLRHTKNSYIRPSTLITLQCIRLLVTPNHLFLLTSLDLFAVCSLSIISFWRSILPEHWQTVRVRLWLVAGPALQRPGRHRGFKWARLAPFTSHCRRTVSAGRGPDKNSSAAGRRNWVCKTGTHVVGHHALTRTAVGVRCHCCISGHFSSSLKRSLFVYIPF